MYITKGKGERQSVTHTHNVNALTNSCAAIIKDACTQINEGRLLRSPLAHQFGESFDVLAELCPNFLFVRDTTLSSSAGLAHFL